MLRLGRRGLIFPSRREIERQSAADSPVIPEKPVEESLTVILVGISKRDRTCIWSSKQEAREIISGGRSRECERSTRVLLRQDVELIQAHITAVRHTVATTVPESVVGNGAVLRAIVRVLAIRQTGNAAGKIESRRSPICWILIVTG